MDYEIIGWPDIQDIMTEEGFEENATLIEPNSSMGIGSSTYLVDKEWLESLKKVNDMANQTNIIIGKPFFLTFDEPWFQEKSCKLKVLEDLGESEEMDFNEETGLKEMITVHKYKVAIVD